MRSLAVSPLSTSTYWELGRPARPLDLLRRCRSERAGPEPTVGDDYIETPILFRGHECVFASSDNEKREPRPMCKAGNSRAQSLARARQVGGAIVMDRPESDLVGRNRIGVVMFGDRPHQMVCQFVDVDRLAQQRIDANLLQAFVVELVAGVGCAQDAG